MLHTNSCKVTIRGNGSGILLNNPATALGVQPSPRRRILAPEEEAKLRLYWTEDGGSLGFPAYNFHRGLIASAVGWKLPSNRKVALPPFIAGDVSVEPAMLPFGTKKYEVFTCRAVVNRQGVLRARPWLKDWKLVFELRWESQHLGTDFHESLLPDLLVRLGSSLGIGDFRPQKNGTFGRFSVESIKAK